MLEGLLLLFAGLVLLALWVPHGVRARADIRKHPIRSNINLEIDRLRMESLYLMPKSSSGALLHRSEHPIEQKTEFF